MNAIVFHPVYLLVIGLLLSPTISPSLKNTLRRYIPIGLSLVIVGMGSSITKESLTLLCLSDVFMISGFIVATLVIGRSLIKKIDIEKTLGILLVVGTAICGGSAIAAMSTVLKPTSKTLTTAFATVFILSSLSILIFPIIGTTFHLSDKQFAIWSAIAIHDTSSVIATSLQFSATAAALALPLKLLRAVNLIPLVFLKSHGTTQKGTHRLFIISVLGFIIMATLSMLFPEGKNIYLSITQLSKVFMYTALCLIGITTPIQHCFDKRAFGFALCLWSLLSLGSFILIYIL